MESWPSLVEDKTPRSVPPGPKGIRLGASEGASPMDVEEFLSWLALTDLSAHQSKPTREMLERLFPAIPNSSQYDELASAVEGFLEDPDFHPEQLSQLRERFAHLLPRAQTPLEMVEDGLERMAEGLDEEAYESDRLVRFEAILRGLDSEPDEARAGRLLQRLDALEGEFRAIWADYSAMDIQEAEVTAESVAGHRYLEEAFQSWFQALAQARDGELDEAWESATEGNRLLLAVSTWSDSLRDQPSANMGEG